MDLVAKETMVKLDNNSISSPLFLVKNKNNDNLILGERIMIENSVKYSNEIISYLKNIWPKAKYVFINFPTEGYPVDHVIHSRRSKFNNLFFNRQLDLYIDAHVNDKLYLTDEPQHFKSQYYAHLASMIYSSLFS